MKTRLAAEKESGTGKINHTPRIAKNYKNDGGDLWFDNRFHFLF